MATAKSSSDSSEDMNLRKLSAAYCVSRFADPIEDELIEKINDNSELQVYIKKSNEEIEDVKTKSRIPIILTSQPTSIPDNEFDFDLYYNTLQTSRFGQTVIYAEVTTTTLDLIEPFTSIDGLVAIAGVQTQGRGRRKNAWISPKGCAMFCLSFHLPLSSELGKNEGLIQHLVTLAVLRGITRVPGYEQLTKLSLKWPNDIYWEKAVKVAGSIIKTNSTDTELHCVAAVGLNVTNSYPGPPLNELIKRHAETKRLQPLTVEEVIARTLNEIDYLIQETEREGIEMLKAFYLKNWLHTEQRVNCDKLKNQVTIKGINDKGFMLVEDDDGLNYVFGYDANSFDLMNNMIVSVLDYDSE